MDKLQIKSQRGKEATFSCRIEFIPFAIARIEPVKEVVRLKADLRRLHEQSKREPESNPGMDHRRGADRALTIR